MAKIYSAIPLESYILDVTLDNGWNMSIDFSKRLDTIRFSCLAEDDAFGHFRADANHIVWDCGLEMSVSELVSSANWE